MLLVAFDDACRAAPPKRGKRKSKNERKLPQLTREAAETRVSHWDNVRRARLCPRLLFSSHVSRPFDFPRNRELVGFFNLKVFIKE